MVTIYACLKKASQELQFLAKQSLPLLMLLLVLLSIPLGYAVNSIAMGLFSITTLVYLKKANVMVDKYLMLPVLLYLLMAVSLLWSIDLTNSVKAVSKELPLLIVPLCFMTFSSYDSFKKEILLKYYSVGMVFYVIYFLAKAIVKYCITKDSSVFFYHELVTYDLNAIHISLYTTLAFYYFYTQPNRSILASAISFLLAAFIFLLSSKNIIIVFILLLFIFEGFYSNKKLKLKNVGLTILIVISSFILFSSKIKERFLLEFKSDAIVNSTNMAKGNVNKVSIQEAWTQDKFQQNYFFSGTAFRVYQIRVFKELLTEESILFTGYGLNAADSKVQKKGQEHTVFSGDATHYGYQTLDFHNQYIQIFAETGIFGLIILLLIVSLSLRNAIKSKDFRSITFSVVMISLFLTESILIRQRGIAFFILLYCIFNSRKNAIVDENSYLPNDFLLPKFDCKKE